MKHLTGVMTDHYQADATVTYSLISAVGENIQCQHDSSSSISIFLGNTSHFIPIQWHSKLSILDTEQQIYFNIKELKQTDAVAANLQISIQKDSRPSEFKRPLTSITLILNGDLPVDRRRRVSLLKLPVLPP